MGDKRAETVEESVLYRKPMQVKEVLLHEGLLYDFNTKHTFPICPKCDVPMEYEFQNYCGHCGQRLNWIHYNKAKFRYPKKNT